MAILNMTPDSFSDGGEYINEKDALSKTEKMIEEGADIIDVGGESSRPGALPVSANEEIRRIAKTIESIRKRWDIPVSVDTVKQDVARIAVEEGADIINDISALSYDPEMVTYAAKQKTPVILMHSKGSPRTMQDNPVYGDVVKEIHNYFENAVQKAEKAGIKKERIIIDPGIGFGKTAQHNLILINKLGAFKDIGCPLMVGLSRKSFLGTLLGTNPSDRLEGTIAANAIAIANGAAIIRVHDVKEGVKTAKTADSIIKEILC